MITLQPREKILAGYRRHWLALFFVFFRIALGLFAVILAPLLIQLYAPEVFSDYAQFVILLGVLGGQVLWVFLFLGITDYYLDMWFITNQRLILVELRGVFNRTVTSVDFVNIQDVSTRVAGILQTVLHFGDVVVQSAGTHGEFIFQQVSCPDDVRERILEARKEFLKTHPDAR